jgi:hypothetical protein
MSCSPSFRRQTRARLDDTDTEDLLGVLLRTEDLADVDDLTDVVPPDQLTAGAPRF